MGIGIALRKASFKQAASLTVVFSLLLNNAALAADLDVAGARARYETQRRIADSSRDRLDAQATRLRQYEAIAQQAENEETNARNTLQNEESRLAQIENSLSSYESQIASLRDRYQRLEQRRSNLESRIPEKRAQVERLTQRIADLDQRIQQVQTRIQNLEGKEGKEAELAEARQRLANLQNERQEAYNNYQNASGDLSRLENELQDVDRESRQVQNQIRDYENQYANLNRDHERQTRVVQDARDNLRRKTDTSEQAWNDVRRVQADYSAAELEWNREESRAQSLYAYYQQVQANYNAALEDVYRQADQAASSHAYREASERAPEKGKADGSSAAFAQGVAKGEKDGNLRDEVRGYLDGRKVGASDPNLAASYKIGIQKGQAAATAKASAEDLPRSYNADLKAHFATSPTQEATIDISEELPGDPGGSGNYLSLKDKSIGNVAPPTFTNPTEPVPAAPKYQVPGVSVPAPLKLYYAPPCDNLVLAEFGPMCRSRYEQGYNSFFNSSYQQIYRDGYKGTFEAQVGGIYETTFAKGYAAATAKGRAAGAEAQGVLDGFDKALPAAKLAAVEAGKKQLKADLATGAFLVFRGAEIQELSGDGLFTPGEQAKLTLIVENFGLEASALAKARLRITGIRGVKDLNFTVRELPAIAPNSRARLTGVLSAAVATQLAAEKFGVQGVLEVEQAGKWTQVATVGAEAETHFPLELVDIALPKNPKVNEEVEATFQFKNLTRGALPAVPMKLGTTTNIVAIAAPDTEVAATESGATSEVKVKIKPGNWVGENTYVSFTATPTSTEGLMKQAFAKFIKIDRSAALLLYDGAGKEVPSSTFKVKAGSRVPVVMNLKVNSTKTIPGPVQVRQAKFSGPGISSTSNSTVGWNLGSVNPTTKHQMKLSYDIAASAKGQTLWAMVTLQEGNNVIQAQMVYFEVE